MKPVLASAATTAATDEQLVAAAREGSDEAVEALFRRYREKITTYARGIVGDPGKAEDCVQETFMSALRSLRATDREIAFRPWIYQIAKNACIDQIRRQKRTEEISIDSDDFTPHHEGRLSQSAPTTHGAASQREAMHVLTQAFGGLPRSQHEILVLRELEGRSYDEIARRLDLSRSAVESMLFRARRGLKDEYEEITTGERCRRTHVLIAAVAEGMGSARDRRSISRHARLCTTCRHEAFAMGLGELAAPGKVRSALNRAAALLPLPFFRRGASGGESSGAALGGRAQNILSRFGPIAAPGAEQATLVPTAVAALVAAALIGGGGIVGKSSAESTKLPAAAVTAGGGTAGTAGGPGVPGQPPSGSTTIAPTSGSPGLGTGLSQGSQQSAGAPSSSVLSPSLLPASGGGTGNGDSPGAGLLGGLPLSGGNGSGVAPIKGIQLPGVNGIKVPGIAGGGGGQPSVGGQEIPRLQPPSVSRPELPSLGSPRLGDLPAIPRSPLPRPPSVSRPSVPPVSAPAPSVPSVPSVPALPATPSAPSASAVGGIVGGVTGTAGPSLPSLPGR